MPSGFVVQTTHCPAGKKILGGGAVIVNLTGISTIQTRGPADEHSWSVGVGNTQAGTNTFTLFVVAMCANVQ